MTRRDQRTVLLRSTGCWFVPSPSRPIPFHSANPRARHEVAWCRVVAAAGFRLRLGGGGCAPTFASNSAIYDSNLTTSRH